MARRTQRILVRCGCALALSLAGCRATTPRDDAAGSGGQGGAAQPIAGAMSVVAGSGGAAMGSAGAGVGGAAMTGTGGVGGGQVGQSGGGGMQAGTGGAAADAGAIVDAASADADAGAVALPADITVWIAGDSTVAKGNTPCPVGWGASLAEHFKNTVTVVNNAVGGRSVRTWLYNVGTTMDASGECVLAKDASGEPTVQARWQAMLDGMDTGDYLLIQFGINDSSATCDRHVGLAAFKESYGVMAQAAKDRGAQPIFITPVSAIACNGDTARATRGAFVTATIEAGTTYDVPVLDLHQASIDLYDRLDFCPIPGGDVSAATSGPVGDFFCDDHTHFSAQGAPRIAELVVQALRDQDLGLAAYLK